MSHLKHPIEYCSIWEITRNRWRYSKTEEEECLILFSNTDVVILHEKKTDVRNLKSKYTVKTYVPHISSSSWSVHSFKTVFPQDISKHIETWLFVVVCPLFPLFSDHQNWHVRRIWWNAANTNKIFVIIPQFLIRVVQRWLCLLRAKCHLQMFVTWVWTINLVMIMILLSLCSGWQFCFRNNKNTDSGLSSWWQENNLSQQGMVTKINSRFSGCRGTTEGTENRESKSRTISGVIENISCSGCWISMLEWQMDTKHDTWCEDQICAVTMEVHWRQVYSNRFVHVLYLRWPISTTTLCFKPHSSGVCFDTRLNTMHRLKHEYIVAPNPTFSGLHQLSWGRSDMQNRWVHPTSLGVLKQTKHIHWCYFIVSWFLLSYLNYIPLASLKSNSNAKKYDCTQSRYTLCMGTSSWMCPWCDASFGNWCSGYEGQCFIQKTFIEAPNVVYSMFSPQLSISKWNRQKNKTHTHTLRSQGANELIAWSKFLFLQNYLFWVFQAPISWCLCHRDLDRIEATSHQDSQDKKIFLATGNIFDTQQQATIWQHSYIYQLLLVLTFK